MVYVLSISAFLVDVNSDPDPFTTLFVALGIALALLTGLRLLVSKPAPGESLPDLFKPLNYATRVMLPIMLITAGVATVALLSDQNDFDQIEVDDDRITFRHSLLGSEVSAAKTDISGYRIDTEFMATGRKNDVGQTAFVAAVALRDGRVLESDPWTRRDTVAAMEKAGIRLLSSEGSP